MVCHNAPVRHLPAAHGTDFRRGNMVFLPDDARQIEKKSIIGGSLTTDSSRNFLVSVAAE